MISESQRVTNWVRNFLKEKRESKKKKKKNLDRFEFTVDRDRT